MYIKLQVQLRFVSDKHYITNINNRYSLGQKYGLTLPKIQYVYINPLRTKTYVRRIFHPHSLILTHIMCEWRLIFQAETLRKIRQFSNFHCAWCCRYTLPKIWIYESMSRDRWEKNVLCGLYVWPRLRSFLIASPKFSQPHAEEWLPPHPPTSAPTPLIFLFAKCNNFEIGVFVKLHRMIRLFEIDLYSIEHNFSVIFTTFWSFPFFLLLHLPRAPVSHFPSPPSEGEVSLVRAWNLYSCLLYIPTHPLF